MGVIGKKITALVEGETIYATTGDYSDYSVSGVFRVARGFTLQDEYRCFFSIVDYHAISQAYEKKEMQARVFDMAVDLLALGIFGVSISIFFVK